MSSKKNEPNKQTKTNKTKDPSKDKRNKPIKHKSTKEKMPTAKYNGIKLEIISLLVFVAAIFVYISVTKFKGMPEDIQFIGWLGTYLMKGLEYLFGEAAICVAFFLLFWSIHIGIEKKLWSIRMWGISLFFLISVVATGIYKIPGGMNPWEAGQRNMGGGLLGGLTAYVWVSLFGQIGTLILLILGGVIGLLMVINKPLQEIIKVFLNIFHLIKARLSNFIYFEANGVMPEANIKQSKEAPRNNKLIVEENSLILPVFNEKEIKIISPASDNRDNRAESYQPVVSEKELDEIIDSNQEAKENYDYQKPPLDLLNEIKSEQTFDKKNIKESIAILEDTFLSFGISVKVNQVSCGPAVTRYELTPAPGVKVSKIISLTDDLQLNLAASGIRIEAPIPGKSAIGIEVPNKKVAGVGLRNLLQSSNFKKLNTPLAIALGEDIAGNTVVARLSDMPHLLVAGSTGSGKSVCLNSILMSLLYNTVPDELRLVLIDPKMVELTVYNGVPHLLTPVVTNPKKAAIVLRWMVTEMEKRYRLFAEKGVRDITRYNQSAGEPLPYIVIIIDELADLMMVAPIEVEDSICRLAQMARAAGMHLIVATQRPSVDVVTGIIKANIPSRIAFAVSSQADSRTILDMGGADKLLGKGDMLFFPVGAVKPYRVQGAYVSDADIDKTVAFIKQQTPKPSTEDSETFEEIETSLINDKFEEDELFWDAVSIFVDGQKASVSLLQRRLRIGYARAARLVDLMEDKGIVSELDNNKKREILIDNDQLEKLYAKQKLC